MRGGGGPSFVKSDSVHEDDPPPLGRASADNGGPGREGEGGRARSEEQSMGPSQTWGRDWTSRSEMRTGFLVISTREGLLQDGTAPGGAGGRQCPTQESPARVTAFSADTPQLRRRCPAKLPSRCEEGRLSQTDGRGAGSPDTCTTSNAERSAPTSNRKTKKHTTL